MEVTTLVIPTKNDSPEEITAIARFIASIDPEIPYHLSCYYPQYRYRLPPTPASTVRNLARIASEHLSFVYLGNVGLEETNTSCPDCDHLLIQRRGYHTQVSGIKNSACMNCGHTLKIPGV